MYDALNEYHSFSSDTLGLDPGYRIFMAIGLQKGSGSLFGGYPFYCK
jgi:hypothetical protein